MKKIKVFIYLHQGILKGGVEKVFYTLLNNISMEMYDITVLSVMGYLSNDFESNLYPQQVTRHCLMWDEFSQTNLIKRIFQKIHNRYFASLYKKIISHKKFDIAIAAQEGFYADFIDRNINAKKKFLWIHNDIELCHWSLKHFGNIDSELKCYQKFNKIICVSEKVRESMQKVFRDKLNNLCVCHNPIDTHIIDEKIHEILPSRPEHTWFICIGRLVHQKGFDRLIKVCDRLNGEGYKYQISILGEGEDHASLDKLLKELKITNVELLGNQSNPFKFLKNADWFLQTSRHEGFGLALYESAYCKTPVITTDVAGARELLGDSEFGIITENSTEGIYKALKYVLDNPQTHEEFKTKIGKKASTISLQNSITEITRILNG